MRLEFGVKSDPIEYRHSPGWLFDLLASEGVAHVQLGTWFELYQLPDAFFADLRRRAEASGVRISSVFTSHRELGGLFHPDPAFHAVAERNTRRLIEVGALVGADSVGWNPGAVFRESPEQKEEGIRRFLGAIPALAEHAKAVGVKRLTLEPMSCAAEPPTSSDEIRRFGEAGRGLAVPVGLCADVSHGWADAQGRIVESNVALYDACLPYLHEVHLKNTDARFDRTFGFSEEERARGIVDPAVFAARTQGAPVDPLIAYLELPGPKLGRDYSDPLLAPALRESIRFCRATWSSVGADAPEPARRPDVRWAPSLMCADMLRLGEAVRELDAEGVDLLHLDIMDGGFVPNLPLGLEAVRALKAVTSTPLDAHLMVQDPDFFVDLLAEAGADRICVHAETCRHFDRTLSNIRARGLQAGVALNPATPLSALDWVWDRIDFLLLMTVNPGFAGQALVPNALDKIAAARAVYGGEIMVDGNVSFDNIPAMVQAGATTLVLGTSSLFHRSAPVSANAKHIRSLLEAM